MKGAFIICSTPMYRIRREDIFRDDVDRQDYLKTLAEPVRKQAGNLRQETAQGKAERMVTEELRREKFGRWQRCSLVTDPCGYAPGERFASGQNPGVIW